MYIIHQGFYNKIKCFIKMSYDDAILYCNRFKMKVIEFTSPAEIDDFVKHTQKEPPHHGFWIGLKLRNNNTFFWETSGLKLNYSRWSKGSPVTSKYALLSQCVIIEGKDLNYTFRQISCTKNYYAACYRDDPIVMTTVPNHQSAHVISKSTTARGITRISVQGTTEHGQHQNSGKLSTTSRHPIVHLVSYNNNTIRPKLHKKNPEIRQFSWTTNANFFTTVLPRSTKQSTSVIFDKKINIERNNLNVNNASVLLSRTTQTYLFTTVLCIFGFRTFGAR